MKTITAAIVLLVGLGAQDLDASQRGGGRTSQRGPKGPLAVHEPPAAPGIAWFGTVDGALEEAKRTGRPILFMSAAPQCQNVPGVW